MENVIIRSDALEVEISSFGAEIQSVKNYNEIEFMWCGDKNIWDGKAPILFPICGGLKEEKYIYKNKEYSIPKHGFAKHMNFDLENKEFDSAVFLLKSNEDTLKCYPFDFELRISYKVERNKLHINCNVKNMKSDPMYFSFGSHEAYSCPEGIDEYDVVFEKSETLDSYKVNGNLITDKTVRVLENNTVLPMKTDYFKTDALIFKKTKSKSVTLAQRNGSRKIKVTFPDFPCLLFWTKPGAKYLCIEPWCGMADIEGSSFDFTKKEGIVEVVGNGEKNLYHSIEFFA